MCGIFGIFYPGRVSIEDRNVEHMASCLRHRGPDHTGVFVEPGVVIGNTRLAMVDVGSGNQPIFSPCGNWVIVYNGELYNHEALRSQLQARESIIFSTRTDTEVVLHAFRVYGAACLDKLNGMFAFAIWNKRERSLFIARDTYGIKPLYFAPLPKGGLAFASEAKALLDILPNGAAPNWGAISQYFHYGYVPLAKSPFMGIEKLPPGHYAKIGEEEKWEVTRWHTPSYGQGISMPVGEAANYAWELLMESVDQELAADVPLGLFLSGGMDSSAIAACAAKIRPNRIEAFALRFKEESHDESIDARLVADYLGLKYHELYLDDARLLDALEDVRKTLDEPFGDITVLPLLALAKVTRQHVKGVLTGWGGDEIFAGYPTYRAHQLARCYRKLPSFLTNGFIPYLVNRLPVSSHYMSFEFKAKRFILGADSPPEFQHLMWMGYFRQNQIAALLTPDVQAQVKDDVWEPLRQTLSELTEANLLDRILHLDALFFLHGNGLFQADRMTMAASLEARVPILNRKLVDFLNPLPISVKMPKGKPKGLMRIMLEGKLPMRILNKPKKGFGPPASAWVSGVLREQFLSVLSPEKIHQQGIFQSEEIERLLREHLTHHADHGRNLWAILSFQLWYDSFIEGRR